MTLDEKYSKNKNVQFRKIKKKYEREIKIKIL